MVAVQPETQMVEPIVDCVTSGFSAPGVQAGSGSGKSACEQVASVVAGLASATPARPPDKTATRVKEQ